MTYYTAVVSPAPSQLVPFQRLSPYRAGLWRGLLPVLQLLLAPNGFFWHLFDGRGGGTYYLPLLRAYALAPLTPLVNAQGCPSRHPAFPRFRRTFGSAARLASSPISFTSWPLYPALPISQALLPALWFATASLPSPVLFTPRLPAQIFCAGSLRQRTVGAAPGPTTSSCGIHERTSALYAFKKPGRTTIACRAACHLSCFLDVLDYPVGITLRNYAVGGAVGTRGLDADGFAEETEDMDAARSAGGSGN